MPVSVGMAMAEFEVPKSMAQKAGLGLCMGARILSATARGDEPGSPSGRVVEAETQPGLAPRDQLGHGLAGARAMGPAQRAVAGVDPQIRRLAAAADVGDVGRRAGAQAGPVVALGEVGHAREQFLVAL